MTESTLSMAINRFMDTWTLDDSVKLTTTDGNCSYYWTYQTPPNPHWTIPLPTQIENEFDNMVSSWWTTKDDPVIYDGANLPKTNITEDKFGLRIECSLPFVEKENVDVTLDPSINSIKIEVNAHQEISKELKDALDGVTFNPNYVTEKERSTIQKNIKEKYKKTPNTKQHLVEISRTSFKRTFVIHKKFDLSKAEATFENSVLTINVPISENHKLQKLTIS